MKIGDIIKFPTRIDTKQFCKQSQEDCRQKLGLPNSETIIVTSGRLHWAKGWEFLLDAFRLFLKNEPNSRFFFIGDGNSRNKIERYISKHRLEKKVFIQGFQSHDKISNYLNAADLYVMGSIMEGWATSLMEAKACGVPICTTDFSSAKDIVKNGINGFVIEKRDIEVFAIKMAQAIELKIDLDILKKEMEQ